MRYSLLPLLFASCVAAPSPEPAIQATALAREVYHATSAGNEALVRRSNPSPDALAAYLEVSRKSREAYDRAADAAVAAIGSMSSMSPQQLDEMTDRILDTIKAIKEK